MKDNDRRQRPMHAPPSRAEYDRYLDWLREQEEAGLRRLGRMPSRLSVPEAADFLRVAEQVIWDAIGTGEVAAVADQGVVRVDTATLFDDLGIDRPAASDLSSQVQPGARQ